MAGWHFVGRKRLVPLLLLLQLLRLPLLLLLLQLLHLLLVLLLRLQHLAAAVVAGRCGCAAATGRAVDGVAKACMAARGKSAHLLLLPLPPPSFELPPSSLGWL